MKSTLKKVCSLASKVMTLLRTYYYYLIYYPFITSGRRCKIHKGFTINEFKTKTDKDGLQIILDGHNTIGIYCLFQGSAKIHFGLNSYCAGYNVLGANAGIEIGKNVMIAPHTTIRDTDHRIEDVDIPMYTQGRESRKVTIEDDVWVGHGAAILKGVTIGTGAVVGAGAVVTKDVPPYAVVGGVPARILRYRKANGDTEPPRSKAPSE